jgi:hypothetical protein
MEEYVLVVRKSSRSSVVGTVSAPTVWFAECIDRPRLERMFMQFKHRHLQACYSSRDLVALKRTGLFLL